ncbi:DUF2892 domain-containing protein [Actinomycetes bacterium NPDC127524]
MNDKQNISIMNGFVRMACGLTLLTWTTAKLVRKPWKQSYVLTAMLASMKVASGATRYCPITDAMERNRDLADAVMPDAIKQEMHK